MILACMYASHRTAWECDLAETYGIFDYESIPVRKLATLTAGLRSDSRSMMELSGLKIPLRDTLLAVIADCTKWLVWSRTEDGQHGRNMPESILEMLTSAPKETNSDHMTFETGEDFIKERNRILSLMKEE